MWYMINEMYIEFIHDNELIRMCKKIAEWRCMGKWICQFFHKPRKKNKSSYFLRQLNVEQGVCIATQSSLDRLVHLPQVDAELKEYL